MRRKIRPRPTEDNAKCCHLKKLTCKGTLRQVFIFLRPRIPYTIPHLNTAYMYTVYLFIKGRGERGRCEPERRLEKQQFTKLGRKYRHDWLYLQSINSDKHQPQSPFTGQFFMTTFCFGVYIVHWSMYQCILLISGERWVPVLRGYEQRAPSGFTARKYHFLWRKFSIWRSF